MGKEAAHVLLFLFLIPAAFTDFVLCRLSLAWIACWCAFSVLFHLFTGAGAPSLLFDLLPGLILFAAALSGKGLTVGDALSVAVTCCLVGWEEGLQTVLAASVICAVFMAVRRRKNGPFLPGMLAGAWLLEAAGLLTG